MRVLLLGRGSRSGLATARENLRKGLSAEGVEAHALDASAWMPADTESRTNRDAAKRLKAIAQDYDLVHAFGYRCAWACADAFGDREGWGFTVYDAPKTNHPALLDRLRLSAFGITGSHAIRVALRELNIACETITPGQALPKVDLDRPACRRLLNLDDRPAAIAMGRFAPDRDFSVFLRGLEGLSDFQGLLMGEGDTECSCPPNVRLLPWTERPLESLKAADVVVVPSLTAGWSHVAMEAMALGIPTLLRRQPAFDEIGMEGASVGRFDDADDLSRMLTEWMNSPMLLESLSRAASSYAIDQFDAERHARQTVATYRRVVS